MYPGTKNMTVYRAGSGWRALFHLCWLFGHGEEHVVDCDARRSFNRCIRCGREWQYEFQENISPDWIGFIDEIHRCPLCLGWKPRSWDRCQNEICELNPDGPLHLLPDGTVTHDPDARLRRAP